MEWSNAIWFVLGIGGNLIASAIWERWKESPAKEQRWKERLQSADASVRAEAARECMTNAFYWYIIANILWVISGTAWALDVLEGIGVAGGLIGRVVMVVTAVLSLTIFGIALSWVRRIARHAPET